jgi:hypothetical protein
MTTNIPPGGKLLAQVGQTAYVEVHAVVSINRTTTKYYCAVDAWPASPVAQDCERMAEIARLEARLAELRAQKPRNVAILEVAPPQTEVLSEASLACEHCGRTFPKAHGLRVHQASCGKERPQKPIYASEPTVVETMALVPEYPPVQEFAKAHWCCADCDTDVFAADLHEPTLCLKCATKARAAQLEAA